MYKAIDCSHPFYHNKKWAPKDHAYSRLTLQDLREAEQRQQLEAASSSSKSSRKHVQQSSSSSSSSRGSPYASLITARKHLKALSHSTYSLRKQEGGNPVYVALKRIYVTSSPQRIQNELEILAQLRSARCTAYLISAIRHEDQVIAVMPYEKHQDFRVSRCERANERTSEASAPRECVHACEGSKRAWRGCLPMVGKRAEQARHVQIELASEQASRGIADLLEIQTPVINTEMMLDRQ